jgi:hypothetical protein
MTVTAAPFRMPTDLSAETTGKVCDAVALACVATAQGDGGVWLDCAEPTVVAVTMAAMLHRAGEIDRVVVLTERHKTGFWVDEFVDHTALTPLCHYGTGREQRLAKVGPDVLVSTYETLRPELAVRVRRAGSRGNGAWSPGPLVSTLDLFASRTLWICTDLDKLAHRNTETHQGFEFFLRKAREQSRQRLLGLGTVDLDDHLRAYDLGRIFCPGRMPSVHEFESRYCFPVYAEEPVLRPPMTAEFHRLFSGMFVR